jgi:hypothetical protein
MIGHEPTQHSTEGGAMKRGTRVRFSNGTGNADGTGTVAKFHRLSGRDGLGAVEIYADDRKKLTRKVRHVTAI